MIDGLQGTVGGDGDEARGVDDAVRRVDPPHLPCAGMLSDKPRWGKLSPASTRTSSNRWASIASSRNEC